MQAKLLDQSEERTYAVIFRTGDEAMSGLCEFAQANGLGGSHFTAIGAFEHVTLAYFDWEKREYRKIPLDEQVEALSLVGDISLKDGKAEVHAHVVVGRSDGTTRGGHLMEARVRPTLEVLITEAPKHMRRRYDEESGLALIDLEATP